MAAEIIDIRQFDAKQFAPLLQVESRVWGSGLRWDYASSARLISSCLDEKRLQGYALVLDGQIRGYSFYFCEGDKGLIGNLFVDPESAGPPHALLLIQRVIETVNVIPGIDRVETQLPHYSFDELNPCFVAHGFQGYRRRFMAADLAAGPSAASLPGRASAAGGNSAPGDFVMEPWERKHDRQAATLLHQTYKSHIDAAINDQYASHAGASRLIENIVHQKGCGEFLQKSSQVAIHRASGKLAGVLALTSVRRFTAHIPQIAVAKEFQGFGLGSRMLAHCFEDVHGRGFEEVSLTVTDLNTGAVRLYERMGFQTFRAFGAFVWSRRA